jgi:hypothetical protein
MKRDLNRALASYRVGAYRYTVRGSCVVSYKETQLFRSVGDSGLVLFPHAFGSARWAMQASQGITGKFS